MNKIQNHVEQKVVLIKRWQKTKSTRRKISKTSHKENNGQNTRGTWDIFFIKSAYKSVKYLSLKPRIFSLFPIDKILPKAGILDKEHVEFCKWWGSWKSRFECFFR